MTKNVRVENADNGSYKVKVEVWDKGPVAEEGKVSADTLAYVVDLDFPTAMANIGITSTRYLVIKELT